MCYNAVQSSRVVSHDAGGSSRLAEVSACSGSRLIQAMQLRWRAHTRLGPAYELTLRLRRFVGSGAPRMGRGGSGDRRAGCEGRLFPPARAPLHVQHEDTRAVPTTTRNPIRLARLCPPVAAPVPAPDRGVRFVFLHEDRASPVSVWAVACLGTPRAASSPAAEAAIQSRGVRLASLHLAKRILEYLFIIGLRSSRGTRNWL